MDILKAFGKAVKLRRVELDLSQEDLAGRTGLARSFISGMERGETAASVRSIGQLATALECQPSDLWLVAERLMQSKSSGA